MSAKIRVLSIFFIVLFAILIVRLFYWQVIKGATLSSEARSQYESSVVTSAPRGNILASDGSFWLSQWGGPDSVVHLTHAGALLSGFNSGVFGSDGLALDPADGTLWMSNGNNTLYQFSQAGSPLQSQVYSGVSGQLLGMEFATVPEPSTLALLGMSAFGLLAWVWRRRRV